MHAIWKRGSFGICIGGTTTVLCGDPPGYGQQWILTKLADGGARQRCLTASGMAAQQNCA